MRWHSTLYEGSSRQEPSAHIRNYPAESLKLLFVPMLLN